MNVILISVDLVETLEEARLKAHKAQFTTDLSSGKEDDENFKDKQKQNQLRNKSSSTSSQLTIFSPPAFKTNQISLKVHEHESSSDEVCYDTDKDGPYEPYPKIDHEILDNNVQKLSSLIDSPIEKITVENEGIYQYQENGLLKNSSTLVKKKLSFLNESSDKIICVEEKLSSPSVNVDTKKNKKCLMPPEDFQKFVVNNITKIKYDILGLTHTINQTYILLENLSNSKFSANLEQNSINLDEYFPINCEEQLLSFENKISSDKTFRSAIASKLSLFVGTKSVGDSVRRLMSQMFCDEMLLNYSLQGFKGKKKFQNLGAYLLLIDSIRIHPKYKNVINKDFDVPLATWLSHAKYRMD